MPVRDADVAVRPTATGATRPPLSRWVLLIAVVQLAVLVATSARYGYHRDEMYFIAAGGHPAFGYPDQPPLVPLISWTMNWLAPGSLPVLRLPSELVAAVTTVIAALIAREIGASARSQVIAAACTAVSAFALAVGHFVTTTTFDLLSTSLLCWLLVRAMMHRSARPLALAGVVVGLGCEAKPQVAFVAVLMIVALAVVGPRWPLRSGWLWLGVLAALLLAGPYLVWQATHGWPQLKVAGNVAGTSEGGQAGFVPFQLVLVSPLLVPVWVAGLVLPWRRTSMRVLRFVPVCFGLLAAAYLLGDGKAYYLASMYPALLALGSVPVADWTRRSAGRARTLTAAVAVSALVSAVIALPLLPPTSLQGSAVMALNPDQGETVGWPRFVDTVTSAWQAVPAAERPNTVIFTDNYGEAGALDLLARGRGLPHVYSGHNGYSLWGSPGPDATRVLLVGYDGPADAAPYFANCTTLATVNNGVGLDNQEQGLPVMLCHPTASWPTLWPKLRHYN